MRPKILIQKGYEKYSKITYHPNVRRYKHTNLIVDVKHPIIMIKDEGPLHPPLPFLSLFSTQHYHTGTSPIPTRLRSLPRPCQECGNGKEAIDEPKHVGCMIVITGVGWFPFVTDVGYC